MKSFIHYLFSFFICFTPLFAKQPNVIVVLTDDMGYGDFGSKGNPHIQTPHLDAMAKRSFEMNRFYVSPVCSPTRASLMTGRDSYRTGVTDTWVGRSTMRSEEVTLAEILKNVGYNTGLFGKWHLGDNYPSRPMDQGFDHALYHMGGGLGQPSEPKENERRYTDAILFQNGKKVKTKGFCCDVYFDRAITWMNQQAQQKKPFFAFIATNTPHSPYHDVPQKWLDYYSKIDLHPKNFPQEKGHPINEKGFNQDTVARVFAMVSNIDDNMGKLFSALKKRNLYEDTIVIYLNDNGPNTYRYVGGFSNKKTSHKEGGIRSPIWWHWPQKLNAGNSDLISAHIDIMPTLAEFCGAQMPQDRTIDGRSIAKTLLGGQQTWDDRTLFIQWHRGDKPESLNNASIVQQNWKIETDQGNTQLYHMKKDPYAMHNVATQFPEVHSKLLNEYQTWLKDLDREYDPMWNPIPIEINFKKEPKVILTHQEWRNMDPGPWHKTGVNGEWFLKTTQPEKVGVRFNLLEEYGPLQAQLSINGEIVQKVSIAPNKGLYHFKTVQLKKGRNVLKIYAKNEKVTTGPWQVFINSLN